MNLYRLDEIYRGKLDPESFEIDTLKQMTRDYPYFSKPFQILARHYFHSGHYKFNEMLRMAAIRVQDRKLLYEYIHGLALAEITAPELTKTEELPEFTHEMIRPGLEEFLSEQELNIIQDKEDLSNEGKKSKPLEFEFENNFRKHGEVEESDQTDIIGEEIATEFSFSKAVIIPFAESEDDEIPVIEDLRDDSINIESEENEVKVSIDEVSIDEIPAIDHLGNDSLNNDSSVNEVESSFAETSKDEDFMGWLGKTNKVQPVLKEENISNTNDQEDLIDRFIRNNPQVSRPRKEFFNPEDMARKSEIPDPELVSETLAGIYYEQGNPELAIRVYEKLSLQNPDKQAYFADLIEKIKKEKK